MDGCGVKRRQPFVAFVVQRLVRETASVKTWLASCKDIRAREAGEMNLLFDGGLQADQKDEDASLD